MKRTAPLLRVLAVLLADIAAAGLCLVVFALFHHVLPKKIESQEWTDPSSATVIERPSPADPDETPAQMADRLTEEVKRYGSSPLPARTVTELPGYDGDGIQIRLRRVEYGSGEEKVTYYAADVFLDSVDLLRASVATRDGGIVTDYVNKQAAANGAIFAVSGDYFKNSEVGLVIRDGYLYRNETTKNDVCILNLDGSMQILRGYSSTSLGSLGRRVWQAWSFGPSLLTENGAVKTSNSQFNIHTTGGTYHNTNEESVNGVYAKHPRNFIGYVEPGHYVFVLVDGRDPGYSCGVSFLDESQIAYDEGCESAYNLDGGRSAMMVFRDELVDKPYKDGRPISDIIYFKP